MLSNRPRQSSGSSGSPGRARPELQIYPGARNPHAGVTRASARRGRRTLHSALLDLGAAQGLVDVRRGHVPADLGEHLVHVARLRDEDGALAEGHGLEELHRQAAGAHLGREPDPALAVVHNLLRLIDAVTHTALAHEHRVLHLLDEARNPDPDVLLADGARWRALPEPRIALEALRGELPMEELHDELGDHVALRGLAPAAREELAVELFDVRVAHVVLPP